MKKDILLIGEVTPRMMDRVSKNCNVHRFENWDRLDKSSITAIITDGHHGTKAEIMEALPNLGIISCYGVGYDAIDVVKAKALGIMVTHTPEVLNEDVANMALALLLATSRNIVAYDAYVRQGEWEIKGNPPLTSSLQGKRVGFLGMGRIGQNIATKCKAFSMEIAYHTRNARPDLPYDYYDNLEAMAKAVNMLIIIAPGGSATRHLVNDKVLAALGEDGILINVGRGSIVDEMALTEALEQGIIKAAGLDVYEDEPRVPKRLRALSQLVLQPHMASATHETRQAMGDLCVDNVLDFLETGKAISPVPEMAD